ncbi:5-carboxymethyl-2-hydroxymuconate Delta-isomerase [Celeribacter sp.]|uniref:5-carboxymethyl-2-hydroxymuconate Delta-isomerase n=1 Tax=Celeribacter sp. TaxID=1890673 RepID=UPI003A92FF60
MPHLVIEYSPGLGADVDISALCRATYGVMARNPLFPLGGIRVRAYEASVAIVADADEENGFVAMTLSVGAGRSKADLHAAGAEIFEAAKSALARSLSGENFALSVNIREIDPDLSWKANPIHARIKRAN